MLDEDGVHWYHGVEQAGRHSTLPFLGAILHNREKESDRWITHGHSTQSHSVTHTHTHTHTGRDTRERQEREVEGETEWQRARPGQKKKTGGGAREGGENVIPLMLRHD